MLMNCKESTQLLSEGEDRPLEAGERLKLKLHLLSCRGCRNYSKQLRFIRSACRQLGSAPRDAK